MKNVKKLLVKMTSVVLLVGIIAFSLIACTSKENTGSKTNSSNAISSLQDFTEGYEKAVFSKFNSYASDNGLEGTKIWIEGIVGDIERLDIGNGMGDAFITLLNSDDGQWVVKLEAEMYEKIEVFEKLKGKDVQVCGIYSGYSDLYHAPAVFAIKIGDIETGKIIKSVMGNLVQMTYDNPGASDYQEIATTQTKDDRSNLTISQQNAVKTAESYLKSMAFSRNGLFQQLTSPYGSQFSEDDGWFAINYLEEHGLVNWNEEAQEEARSYVRSMPFSRNELFQQMTSEYGAGFTPEEAEQAISYLEGNGLVDWNAEAVESAQSYLKSMAFSRDELYQQLTSEYGAGFTPEQAEYALSQVGY